MLSNFFKCSFTLWQVFFHLGVEQAYNYAKIKLVVPQKEQPVMISRLLRCNSAQEVKCLGNDIKGRYHDRYLKFRNGPGVECMRRIVFEKAMTCDTVRNFLRKHPDTYFIEANPSDGFWAAPATPLEVISHIKQLEITGVVWKDNPNNNHMGKIMNSVRDWLVHGKGMPEKLVVGDSMVRNLRINCPVISVAGAHVDHIFDICDLAAGPYTRVLAINVGTNNIMKYAPWVPEFGQSHDHDKPRSANEIAQNFKRRLFVLDHVLNSSDRNEKTKIGVAEVLHRYSDSCNSVDKAQLTRSQKTVVKLNAALHVIATEMKYVQIIPSYEQLLQPSNFRSKDGQLDLHLSLHGNENLSNIFDQFW